MATIDDHYQQIIHYLENQVEEAKADEGCLRAVFSGEQPSLEAHLLVGQEARTIAVDKSEQFRPVEAVAALVECIILGQTNQSRHPAPEADT